MTEKIIKAITCNHTGWTTLYWVTVLFCLIILGVKFG